MRECERLFGVIRGREIEELVEAATGAPCPCSVGCGTCPLARLGDVGGGLLLTLSGGDH